DRLCVVGKQRHVERIARAKAALEAVGGLQTGHCRGTHVHAADHELRQVVERLLDGDKGAVFEYFSVDGQQGAVDLQVTADDAGTSDHDLFDCTPSSFLRRVLRQGSGCVN